MTEGVESHVEQVRTILSNWSFLPLRLPHFHPHPYALCRRMTNQPVPARFSHITDWVFDLDNTLYPHHSNLFSQIDVKMTGYVSELLNLPRDEARKLQKELYLEYGTTLNGLMERHDIDPDDFLQKVHDIDRKSVV